MKNNIKIITPFYNPGEFLETCVNTLMSQKYDSFKVIFVDDCSNDGSFDKLPHDDERTIVIKNETRKTALENIHDAIMNHCDPDDIVALVDGDDWLPNKNTLSYINDFYNQNDCWIMYGQSSWTDGRRGFASAYSEVEFSDLRKSPFRVSHIRTFRAGLYQKIQEQDQAFSCMKDSSGEFYKMTYDVAIMFPIMEMAGYDKVKFNDTILYVYNRSNPISDDRVNQQLQWDIHKEISNKSPFNKIENYI
jgi:glycosyltransferase involved in cell wall biosynthesis